jgi:hypothetical protein
VDSASVVGPLRATHAPEEDSALLDGPLRTTNAPEEDSNAEGDLPAQQASDHDAQSQTDMPEHRCGLWLNSRAGKVSHDDYIACMYVCRL